MSCIRSYRQAQLIRRITKAFQRMSVSGHTTALTFQALGFTIKPLSWPKEES